MKEQAQEKARRVKGHLQKNKKVYLIAGASAATAATGTFLLISPGKSMAVQKIYAIWANNATQNLTQVTVHVRRGHPGNVIRCLETDMTYPSQNFAANAEGVSKTHLSEHLRGKLPHVGGKHFEKIGEAA